MLARCGGAAGRESLEPAGEEGAGGDEHPPPPPAEGRGGARGGLGRGVGVVVRDSRGGERRRSRPVVFNPWF